MQEEIIVWSHSWPELTQLFKQQQCFEENWQEIWVSLRRQEILLQTLSGWLRLSLRDTGRLKCEAIDGRIDMPEPIQSALGLRSKVLENRYLISDHSEQAMKPDYITLEHVLKNPEFLEKGWKAYFPESQSLNLEIGCGYAHFLSWLAPQHPNQAFIGLDIISKVLRRAARRLRSAVPENNVILAKLDALLVLRELIPPASLDHLYILFPDPWPKGRHQTRRTLRADTLPLFASRIKKDHHLIFVSDDTDYATDASALLDASEYFEAVDFPEIEVKTKYERKWLAQKKDIHRLAYQRKHHQNMPDEGSWSSPQSVSEWGFEPFSETQWERLQSTPLPILIKYNQKLIKIQSLFKSEDSPALLMRLILAEPATLAQHGWLSVFPDGKISLPDLGVFPSLLEREQLFKHIHQHLFDRLN